MQGIAGVLMLLYIIIPAHYHLHMYCIYILLSLLCIIYDIAFRLELIDHYRPTLPRTHTRAPHVMACCVILLL